VGAAGCVAAASILLSSPDAYIEIQAVRFSEHSLQLVLVGLVGIVLALSAAWAGRSLRWGLPGLLLNLVVLVVAAIPIVQVYRLAAEYSVPLDPLRTLRAAPLLGWPHTTVAYANVDGQDLLADVFQPVGRTEPAPVVIAVHGGGWADGARADYLPWHEWLAQQGFVVVAIDYRLRPQPNFPAAAQDVQAAVDWVQHNAESIGGDPSRVALVGRSAGGHLALLAAYAQGGPGELPPLNQPVQAVVALYAPTDLAWGYAHTANPNVYDAQASIGHFLGGDPSEMPDQYASASPLTYVRPGVTLPPTLLMQGGHDQLVPLQQLEFLTDALQRIGAPVQSVVIPYGQHGFDLPFEGWSSQLTEGILLRFLKTALSVDQ
jgi:acetyl esterase/lipase